MSEFINNSLGQNVSSFAVSPQFDAYSGVEIIVSEEVSYFAGNRTGRVLTFENQWGTQEQANSILQSLNESGFQYQPFSATGAIISPAAELGDAVTINGVYSGIYKLSKRFTPLMAADIEAPEEKEIDHEFPYEPKQDRVYKRELSEAKAQISINADSISAEVLRATSAEDSLQSAITQTATEISANVVKKTGGSSSSFGWSLNDSSWSASANNSEVFRIDSSGATVKGVIKATSGTIGGFTIGSSALYNGMTSINSTASGVYVGTNGISVGGGSFKVTSSGSVSAANMTLTGTLTIGGTAITAAALRSGAQSAYNNSGYWSNGAGYGYNYNSAQAKNASGRPPWFSAYNLQAQSQLFIGNTAVEWCTRSVKNSAGATITIKYLGVNT